MITMIDVLKSNKLTQKGAVSILEGLLLGTLQVDVNTDEIHVCGGQFPQSYATAESMLDVADADELAEYENDAHGCVEVSEELNIMIKLLDIKEEGLA